MQISSTQFLTTMSALDAFLVHVSLLGSWLPLLACGLPVCQSLCSVESCEEPEKALSGLKKDLAAPAGGHILADLRPWEQQLPKSVRAIAVSDSGQS